MILMSVFMTWELYNSKRIIHSKNILEMKKERTINVTNRNKEQNTGRHVN